mmetsp:Transcript_16241/g.38350  ORF Transcript_16241/g.38350 Transcript_16241/m.38350 type:complete len:173 (-) Transcript_16241:107-625(-)
MYGGLMGARLPAMQRVADSLVVKPSEEAAALAPLRAAEEDQVSMPQPQAHSWGQMRDVIREEMSAALSTLHDNAARPMQFIINNNAQANVEQKTVAAPPPSPPPPPPEPATLLEGVLRFLASPWNRLVLFSALGIGLYVLQGHLAHKWRLEEMKFRRDANPFLRMKSLVDRR